MKKFIHDDFLLSNDTARELFHNHAKELPVIDYHCHLPPEDIAVNRLYNDISEAWLGGDHYKWRAMRANGIAERYCSGDADPKEKFMKWADTMPMLIGNPLYHWSHMELSRYFGIDKLLGPDTAEEIWAEVNEKITSPEYSVMELLKKMKVEVVCTTDDPIDSLIHHEKIATDNSEIQVLPSFRPDKAMNIRVASDFIEYAQQLEKVSGSSTKTYDHFLLALAKRLDYFNQRGCKISDHAFSSLPDTEYSNEEIRKIFLKVISGTEVSEDEADKFSIAVFRELASLYCSKGWSMQIHLGAMRNNSTRILKSYGRDGGADSIGDERQAPGLASILDALDRENKLPPTIIYNLNPADNEVLASMTGNFSSCMAGKMQYGAAWWFLDTKEGIEKQLQTVAGFNLLGRFIGMLTDSRSFLSFPRHEYFRRILCNMIGTKVEAGEYPNDMKLLASLAENISYYNAKNYFNF